MKYCVTIFLAIIFNSLNAQDSTLTMELKSKKGIDILPKSGDFSLGIDATPFLNYAGNIFRLSNTNNIAPTFGFTAQHPGEIYGKYYISDSKAIRFAVLLGFTIKTEKIGGVSSTEQPDKLSQSAVSFGASLGVEKNKRKSRVMGVYGFEGGFKVLPYSGLNLAGDYYVTGTVKYTDESNDSNSYEETGGGVFSLFAAGFVGAEYFFVPKVSLGGEFSLGLAVSSQKERKHKSNSGNSYILDSGYSVVSMSTLASGNLVLHLYF